MTGSPFSPLLHTAAQRAGVSALLVKGNFLFDSANHRDFLGACLGTGIERSKVGDILVQGEQGANILVVPDLVSHLEMNLTSVSAQQLLVSSYSTKTKTAPLYGTVTMCIQFKSSCSIENQQSLQGQSSCAKHAQRGCDHCDLINSCKVICQFRSVSSEAARSALC